MRVLIPLYSVIPLAQVVNRLLVLIVTEKENKIKDGLRMVGVSDGAYWLVQIWVKYEPQNTFKLKQNSGRK